MLKVGDKIVPTKIYQVIIMECAAYSYDEFGPFSSKKLAENAITLKYPELDEDSEIYALVVEIDLNGLK